MDLSTVYLGLKLPHPFLPGASPLSNDMDSVRRLEDAGAAAITMSSLFEEQITREQLSAFHHTESHAEAFGEAASFFPSAEHFRLGPEEYLEHLQHIKRAVRVPVIASLNGTTQGGWLDYARAMERAGADALELNVYQLATDADEDAASIETRTVEMLQAVKGTVRIPVALKLSPFYTSLSHFARRLDRAGADGLVLFNRFYQPDIDVEELRTVPTLQLSHRSELLLRLRWLAILSAQVRPTLAVTGGVHTVDDAVKAIMAGASAVQLVAVLLRHGPGTLNALRLRLTQWLEEHEYNSLTQMRGSMNLKGCPDPQAYERANYMLVLQEWRGV